MLIKLKRFLILSLLLSSFSAWGSNSKLKPKAKSKTEAGAAACTGECLSPSYTDPLKLIREFDKKMSPELVRIPAPPKNPGSLSKIAQYQARKCRVPSKKVRERFNLAPDQVLCGKPSKGMCFQAVKETLVGAKFTKKKLDGENAIEAHTENLLKNEGFENQIRYYDESTAPEEALLVYKDFKLKKGPGHIEFVTYMKTKEGEIVRMYCSDFCSPSPVSSRLPRKLVAVYIKPPKLLTANVEKIKTENSVELL